MTGDATHALGDVDAVIEVNMIGQRIHSIPMQRLLALGANHHRLQHGRVGENLRMASHTRLRRRHPGEGGGFHRYVAVAAVDTQFSCVMAMTEHHGLVARDAHRIPVGRAVVFKGRIRDSDNAKRRAQ